MQAAQFHATESAAVWLLPPFVCSAHISHDSFIKCCDPTQFSHKRLYLPNQNHKMWLRRLWKEIKICILTSELPARDGKVAGRDEDGSEQLQFSFHSHWRCPLQSLEVKKSSGLSTEPHCCFEAKNNQGDLLWFLENSYASCPPFSKANGTQAWDLEAVQARSTFSLEDSLEPNFWTRHKTSVFWLKNMEKVLIYSSHRLSRGNRKHVKGYRNGKRVKHVSRSRWHLGLS